MTSAEIRQKFLDFFKQKGHVIVPSSSLVPQNDSSVLFTTAGMQQFKPYYTGEKDPLKSEFQSKNVASVQKCIRTSDIDEVGDESHLTFFEMLGNFSFGGYFKDEAIKYAHEFITSSDWMGLKIDYVTVFEGEKDIPPDTESESIWKTIDPNIQVRKAGRKDNFWGPTGTEGPCGPTTEIYVDGIEIWNIVFNEYFQHADGHLEKMKVKGVDTGMGLERLTKVVQKVPSVFDTDLFGLIVMAMGPRQNVRAARIAADHIKASTFLIADGVRPSNTDRGYVLRKLLRRARYYNDQLGTKDLGYLAHVVCSIYKHTDYKLDETEVGAVINDEMIKYSAAIGAGEIFLAKKKDISAKDLFVLYSTHGYPYELTLAIAKEKGIDVAEIEKMNKSHQEISRKGAEKKFKGGLADENDPMVVKYHTATHLLHQALHDVLGDHVEQKGSNITAERLRFDFAHGAKMTDEQRRKVEEIVNQKISEKLPMNQITMPKEDAEKTGARHFFGEKYGDQVSVYYIGDDLQSAYSKEFCGGPHVKNTVELAGPEGKWKFKIVKEEAVAQGIRRIKAVIE